MAYICDFYKIFLHFYKRDSNIRHKLLIYFMSFLLSFGCVQGNAEVCQNLQMISHPSDIENCSLVCSLKFEYVVSGVHLDELVLCRKNTTTAVMCGSHGECRHYHPGAYCKVITCLCKTVQVSFNSFTFDPNKKIPKLNACVVSSRNFDPDLPLVPFPWKTLMIVIGIVLLFATFLACIKWLTPLIRSMQAKRTTRENRHGQSELPEDNTSLFSSAPQQNENASTSQQCDSTSTPINYYYPRGICIFRANPRTIFRANPRASQSSNRASSRARYVTCSQAEGTLSGTLSNQDKPPPYETAIQLPPPSYEEVERAILESRNEGFGRIQQVEVHVSPSSVPLTASSSSA
ncbi:uncharacterized protein LOC129972596 [Argiope bruennichi]|nr:uncharacterized protein LOC129972596 [Argiope bruennichi]